MRPCQAERSGAGSPPWQSFGAETNTGGGQLCAQAGDLPIWAAPWSQGSQVEWAAGRRRLVVWGPAQGTWVPGGAPSLPPFQTRASRATSRNLRWGQGHRSGAGQQLKGKESADQRLPALRPPTVTPRGSPTPEAGPPVTSLSPSRMCEEDAPPGPHSVPFAEGSHERPQTTDAGSRAQGGSIVGMPATAAAQAPVRSSLGHPGHVGGGGPV